MRPLRTAMRSLLGGIFAAGVICGAAAALALMAFADAVIGGGPARN